MNEIHHLNPLVFREAPFSLFHLGGLAGFSFAVMAGLKGRDTDET